MKGTSWHGYQLAEQIVKIDVGMAWQLAGTRWLTPAKTGYDLESEKTGMNYRGYDFARVRLTQSGQASVTLQPDSGLFNSLCAGVVKLTV